MNQTQPPTWSFMGIKFTRPPVFGAWTLEIGNIVIFRENGCNGVKYELLFHNGEGL